ncbi:hypothetical protein C8R45DRAFT_939703 [Mycena sanguinolenta]|nr:hypothetical protein C8R45DRAFT_939703 [Mycena sanguinolenta]
MYSQSKHRLWDMSGSVKDSRQLHVCSASFAGERNQPCNYVQTVCRWLHPGCRFHEVVKGRSSQHKTGALISLFDLDATNFFKGSPNLATCLPNWVDAYLVICGLGLACKPGLGLGLTGLWFHFPQAKAQASDRGLAWPGLAWLGLKPWLAIKILVVH